MTSEEYLTTIKILLNYLESVLFRL